MKRNEINIGVNSAQVDGSFNGTSNLETRYSSCTTYSPEEEGWMKEEHPTRSEEQGHILFRDREGTEIHCKAPDGKNEIFNSMLIGRMADDLNMNTTPTFLVFHDNKFWIGSVGYYSTELTPELYQNFKNWEGSCYLTEHFVLNIFFNNTDWGRNKFESYAVDLAKDRTFQGSYAFDFGDIGFGLEGKPTEENIQELSSTQWLHELPNPLGERQFFGEEIWFQYPKLADKVVERVENLKDSKIYNQNRSVARQLRNVMPESDEYHQRLAYSTTKLLIKRKRKLRKWMDELYATKTSLISNYS